MLRLAFIAVAVVPVVLLGCGGGDEAGPATALPPSQNDSGARLVTPVARPRAVPRSAQPVEATITLGHVVRRANEDPRPVETRRIVSAACEMDVMSLETSEEMIYAALPCDRFLDRESMKMFLGEENAIVLEVTEERFRVLLETLEGARAQFTVGGIWVK